MAAGQGYIEFATGDVLTAASANGYLASQVVMVFANAAARTSAIASPQEGMFSYLKDTNSTEYYSGSAWTAIGGGGGGGKVLQVVQGTTTTSTTVASTSYTDTGLSATITPSSATSKVLVMVAQKYILARTAAPTDAGLQIIRGATSIVDYGLRSAHLYATPLSSELQSGTIWSPIYLDSPSTTSSTTYKTQAKLSDTGSSHSITFQQYSGSAVMILMEIGA